MQDSDVRWWHTFIESWNGVSLLRDINTAYPDHEIWSDASGSWGAGAFWVIEWFKLQWPPPLRIAIKELTPIVIACAFWGNYCQGTTVRADCDNEAVVAVINSGYSQDTFMRHLLWCIVFFLAKYDFVLTAAHIPGRLNTLPDAISRNNASLFVSSYPQANTHPREVTVFLVPQEFINELLLQVFVSASKSSCTCDMDKDGRRMSQSLTTLWLQSTTFPPTSIWRSTHTKTLLPSQSG